MYRHTLATPVYRAEYPAALLSSITTGVLSNLMSIHSVHSMHDLLSGSPPQTLLCARSPGPCQLRQNGGQSSWASATGGASVCMPGSPELLHL